MLGPELPESTRSKLCSLQEYLLEKIKTNTMDQSSFLLSNHLHVCGWSQPTRAQVLQPMHPANATQLEVVAMQSNNNNTTIMTEEPPDDVLWLNIQENMNQGKTPSWFHHACHRRCRRALLTLLGKSDLVDTLIRIPQLPLGVCQSTTSSFTTTTTCLWWFTARLFRLWRDPMAVVGVKPSNTRYTCRVNFTFLFS